MQRQDIFDLEGFALPSLFKAQAIPKACVKEGIS